MPKAEPLEIVGALKPKYTLAVWWALIELANHRKRGQFRTSRAKLCKLCGATRRVEGISDALSKLEQNGWIKRKYKVVANKKLLVVKLLKPWRIVKE